MKINFVLITFLIIVQLFQLFLLPVYFLPESELWGISLLLLLPLSNTLWALIHEAMHRLLLPASKINDYIGRLLSVGFGVSFEVVKFCHLMHHRYNRHWESEYYDPAKKTWLKAAPFYYLQCFCGVYLAEIFTSLLFLLPENAIKLMISKISKPFEVPNIKETVYQYFFVKNRIVSVRQDIIAALIVYSLSIYAYDGHLKWFFIMFFGRAFIVSFMDNIYHYATPADNSLQAKAVKSPKWISFLLLNGNFHITHHAKLNVSWHELPEIHQEMGTGFHGTFWQAARAQFFGPIALQKNK